MVESRNGSVSVFSFNFFKCFFTGDSAYEFRKAVFVSLESSQKAFGLWESLGKHSNGLSVTISSTNQQGRVEVSLFLTSSSPLIHNDETWVFEKVQFAKEHAHHTFHFPFSIKTDRITPCIQDRELRKQFLLKKDCL
jgi:hypothetical protein